MSGPKPRVLVVGASGQVATALMEVLPAHGFAATALGRPTLDLERPASIAGAIAEVRPDIVITPAAHTAVDRAEDEPDKAYAINRDGAGAVAAGASARGAAVIHFSTDYVFDGQGTRPYLETDPTAPLGVYGASKLAGEAAVAAANPRHVILRTSWVCSPFGNNFVKTMLRLAAERPELKVVADQRGAPTFAHDIAEATAGIARAVTTRPDERAHYGVFHLVGRGETSWHGFASAIMAEAAARGHRGVPVKAITTAEFPTRARRPAYSMLDCGKLARVYGIELPEWRTGLARCLDRLIGPVRSA